jgi:hypothetical protein
LLQEDRQAFGTVQAKDNRLSIKVAYLLDCVFQSFVNQLARYRSSTSPIRSAKRRLKNFQEDDANEALWQIRFGIAPAVHLSTSISNPPSNNPRHKDRGIRNDSRHDSSRNDDRKKSPASERPAQKPVSNANMLREWKVPEGKRYGDFFNPVKFPENTKGWLKFSHHNTNKPRQAAICMRFQCDGKCNTECNFSHVDSTKKRRDHLSSESNLLMTLGQASSFNGWTGLLSQRSTKSSLRPYVQLWLCQLWTVLTRSSPLAPSQTSTSQFDRRPRPTHRTLGQ